MPTRKAAGGKHQCIVCRTVDCGSTGGSGGAQVTDFGRGVVDRYRVMERKAAEAINSDFAIFSKLLVSKTDESSKSKKAWLFGLSFFYCYKFYRRKDGNRAD